MKKEVTLTVRLTSDILTSVDQLAHQKGVSRANLVRNILANCREFDEFLEAEVAKGVESRIQLEEDLALQVRENLNVEITPVMAKMMEEIMKNVMERVVKEIAQNKRKS